MASEGERWVAALRDKKTREAWLKKTKQHLAESKIAQARAQAALDSDDPDAAIAALCEQILKERAEE